MLMFYVELILKKKTMSSLFALCTWSKLQDIMVMVTNTILFIIFNFYFIVGS